jgi:circadian clock protein KaiB
VPPRRQPPPPWELRLYIAGQTVRSLRAIANLEAICERELTSGYRIEVVDLLEHPECAREDDVVAIPTLVRRFPTPPRKVIGDLSDVDRVLIGLELAPASA